MESGVFIAIEGIDGTGKSTQAQLLTEKLEATKQPVLLTREPGGTKVGEDIRNILLTPGEEIHPWTEVFLYAAARAQLVEEVIRPALLEGTAVVCDRYILSSLAYQGAGRGGDPEKILEINRYATGGLWPHLTVVLDLEVSLARARIRSKNSSFSGDRFEQLEEDFYHRVREEYLDFALKHPSWTKVVSAQGKPEEIHQKVWFQVEDLI